MRGRERVTVRVGLVLGIGRGCVRDVVRVQVRAALDFCQS